jgi:hypothetical protein
MVLGGPGAITLSLVALLIAIVFKSLLYGYFQRESGFVLSFLHMFLANILTSLIGAAVAAIITAGPVPIILLIGLSLTGYLSYGPVQRLSLLCTKFSLSPLFLSLLIPLLLFISMIIWGASREMIGNVNNGNPFVSYWLVKITYVLIAITISLFLTAFWEDWAIYKISGHSSIQQLIAVFRADYITLFCAASYAAIIIIPKRLLYPGYLVDLLSGCLRMT